MDFEDQLSAAMRTSVETLTPPVSGLVSAGLTRGQQRRRRRRQFSAGVLAGVVALAGGGAALVFNAGNDSSSTTAAAGADCHSVTDNGVLPTWARAGFSDPEPTELHVMSARGDMVAILFGRTLSAPPAPDRNNKILWVARVGGASPLIIDAVRSGTTTHVRREVPGAPGPSIIDLPQPGCWHLSLRWGSKRDTMDLVYARP